MQFDNQKTRNVADVAARIMAGETVSEELKGNQHKIDKNKNNKIDAEDFKMLRKEEEEVCEKCGCNPCQCPVEEEAEQIDEVKMADLPSRKVQGKSYGASKPKTNPFDVLKGPKNKDLDAIKKDEKKMVPDWAKGSNESVNTFSAMLESYKQDGLKSLAKMNKLKEEPDNEQFTKEVEEVKKKASEKKSPEDEARVAKGKVDAVKVEEEIEQIEEREMTDAEMKKREEIVKGMKKGMKGFKDRYGDRAKNVMYATATKQAMKEETESNVIKD